MNKHIHLLFILIFIFSVFSYAQDTNTETKINQPVNRYYQTINLDSETPCNCDSKTERTYQLNKGLLTNEVLNYNLHSYKFTFGNSLNAPIKLFKALENDLSVHKVSMKEWESFMLLTSENFDAESFEQAALKAFLSFTKIEPLDFLKNKNISSYLELEKKILKEKNRKDIKLKLDNNTD